MPFSCRRPGEHAWSAPAPASRPASALLHDSLLPRPPRVSFATRQASPPSDRAEESGDAGPAASPPPAPGRGAGPGGAGPHDRCPAPGRWLRLLPIGSACALAVWASRDRRGAPLVTREAMAFPAARPGVQGLICDAAPPPRPRSVSQSGEMPSNESFLAELNAYTLSYRDGSMDRAAQTISCGHLVANTSCAISTCALCAMRRSLGRSPWSGLGCPRASGDARPEHRLEAKSTKFGQRWWKLTYIPSPSPQSEHQRRRRRRNSSRYSGPAWAHAIRKLIKRLRIGSRSRQMLVAVTVCSQPVLPPTDPYTRKRTSLRCSARGSAWISPEGIG